MEAIRKLENKEKGKDEGKNEKEEIVDDGTEFITGIEKKLPPKSFYTRQASDAGNIARQIYADIKESCDYDDVDDTIVNIVALGILPTKIQRQLISIDRTDQTSIPSILMKDWLAYFKYYLLFDPRLKQREGKASTLKELQRRIDEIDVLDCFSEYVTDAYEEVKECISKMTPSEFVKYCRKVPDEIQ